MVLVKSSRKKGLVNVRRIHWAGPSTYSHYGLHRFAFQRHRWAWRQRTVWLLVQYLCACTFIATSIDYLLVIVKEWRKKAKDVQTLTGLIRNCESFEETTSLRGIKLLLIVTWSCVLTIVFGNIMVIIIITLQSQLFPFPVATWDATESQTYAENELISYSWRVFASASVITIFFISVCYFRGCGVKKKVGMAISVCRQLW